MMCVMLTVFGMANRQQLREYQDCHNSDTSATTKKRGSPSTNDERKTQTPEAQGRHHFPKARTNQGEVAQRSLAVQVPEELMIEEQDTRSPERISVAKDQAMPGSTRNVPRAKIRLDTSSAPEGLNSTFDTDRSAVSCSEFCVLNFVYAS